MLFMMMSGVSYAAQAGLDTTFNSPKGFATFRGDAEDMGRRIAIQSDGNILVLGNIVNGFETDILLSRYDTYGEIDTGFGINGAVTYDSGNIDYGMSIALQEDGKIVIAGYCHNGTDDDFLILRYNTDGTLDNGFGNNGVVVYDDGHDERAYAVGLQIKNHYPMEQYIIVGGAAPGSWTNMPDYSAWDAISSFRAVVIFWWPVTMILK